MLDKGLNLIVIRFYLCFIIRISILLLSNVQKKIVNLKKLRFKANLKAVVSKESNRDLKKKKNYASGYIHPRLAVEAFIFFIKLF